MLSREESARRASGLLSLPDATIYNTRSGAARGPATPAPTLRGPVVVFPASAVPAVAGPVSHRDLLRCSGHPQSPRTAVAGAWQLGLSRAAVRRVRSSPVRAAES